MEKYMIYYDISWYVHARQSFGRPPFLNHEATRFFFPQKIPQENLLDRSQLQALVEYQKSAAPGVLAEGQAEMLIGSTKPLGKSKVDFSGKVDIFRR